MRRAFSFILLFFWIAVVAAPAPAAAAATFLLSGKITEVSGEPVAGAEVFVYDSAQTRRPANFISARTGASGTYQLELPAGRYWLVARLRNAGENRPFMGVEKHSGEATEVEATAGGEGNADFTVAQVRDMARRQRKSSGDFVKLEGRIVDRDGEPLRDAYAFAVKEGNPSSLPDYLSYITDEDGSYTLYLPGGAYCLGAATSFPPDDVTVCKKINTSTLGLANIIKLEYPHQHTKDRHSDSDTRNDD